MNIVKEIETAVKYTKEKDFKSAEEIYKNILSYSPDNTTVPAFLGLLYVYWHKYKKAEKYLETAYNISATDNIIYHLALTKYNLKKYEKAAYYFIKYLKPDEKNPINIYIMILKCFKKLEEYIIMCKYAKMAIKDYPFSADILNNLTYALLQTGHFDECQKYLNILLNKYPKNTSAWFTQGILYEVLCGDEKKAQDCYQKIIDYGDKLNGYYHKGISLIKNKKTRKQGYLCFNKVKKLNPEAHGLNFCYATYFLANRKFKLGFKYYTKPDILKEWIPEICQKLNNYWDGKTYPDETLFVYGDQGLGDQLQFCRYLPFAAQKFKKIKVLIPKSLMTLFKRSFSEYKNIKFYEKYAVWPHYDKYTMLSWILYYLNINFDNIPNPSGYLKYKKSLKEKYRKEYFNNKNLKIGICWTPGGFGYREAIHRILNVELFEDIINLKGASVYAFQVKPTNDRYKKYTNLIDVGSTFKNFDDTAAALMNLDLLVTVDTSIAHLAGALGVKTFMLLPYCSDWRWFDNEEKTEWYDSITLFKQQKPLDWDITLGKVLDAINQQYFK